MFLKLLNLEKNTGLGDGGKMTKVTMEDLEMISWKGLEAVVGSELNAFLNYGLENSIFGEDDIKTKEREHRVFRAREGISTYICFHDPEKALSEYREDLQWGLENGIFSPIEIIDGYRKGLFVIGKGMVVRING